MEDTTVVPEMSPAEMSPAETQPAKTKPEPKPKAKKPAPKKAPKPKAKPEPAKAAKTAKPKKVERTVTPTTPGRDGERTWGPGTKQFKFKPVSLRGECDVLGCKAKAHKPTAFRCLKHKKEIRKVQLRENNKTWHKRIEKGTAKHHVVYTSPVTGKQELTEWALLNPDRAIKQVKKGESIVTPEQFAKLAKASKEAAAKNKRGAKGRAK